MLLSVNDAVDTRTAAGRLVLNVLTSVGQWERETGSERTREALTHLKAEGVRLGGAAYGWRRTEARDENGRCVVEDVGAEREGVVRIIDMRSAGFSMQRIALEMTRDPARLPLPTLARRQAGVRSGRPGQAKPLAASAHTLDTRNDGGRVHAWFRVVPRRAGRRVPGHVDADYPVSSTLNLGTNGSWVVATLNIFAVLNALMFRAPFSQA